MGGFCDGETGICKFKICPEFVLCLWPLVMLGFGLWMVFENSLEVNVGLLLGLVMLPCVFLCVCVRYYFRSSYTDDMDDGTFVVIAVLLCIVMGFALGCFIALYRVRYYDQLTTADITSLSEISSAVDVFQFAPSIKANPSICQEGGWTSVSKQARTRVETFHPNYICALYDDISINKTDQPTPPCYFIARAGSPFSLADLTDTWTGWGARFGIDYSLGTSSGQNDEDALQDTLIELLLKYTNSEPGACRPVGGTITLFRNYFNPAPAKESAKVLMLGVGAPAVVAYLGVIYIFVLRRWLCARCKKSTKDDALKMMA